MNLILAPVTATVGRVVVPQVNHISAENLVSTTGAKDHSGKHTTYTAGRLLVEELSSSSSSGHSSDEGIEQYQKEPGVRGTPSRSASEDLDIDLEEYNEEPGTRKQRRGARTGDEATWKDESKVSDKKARKKGPRLEGSVENRSLTFADHLQNSPGISEDVWKEAMAGVPLASSESFDMHLLPSANDQTAGLDDDGDDAFRRRKRRKGKPTRSKDQVSDLKWTADLPLDDSLSHETLDDISCDSYVPPQPTAGWDPDSLEIDLDDYLEGEEGSAKVLDMLAQTLEDSAHSRVVGRRKERVDREEQRKKTLSTSFETNVDDIEFDTGAQRNVPNIDKEKELDPESSNRNVSNINKARQPQTGNGKEKQRKEKETRNGNVSNIDKVNEVAAGKVKGRRPKQQGKDDLELEDEEVGRGKGKKRKEPQKRSATIAIMAADTGMSSMPFEDDEESYSDEPTQDLSANINIRLWHGQTTNIDDDDDDDYLLNDPDHPSSNLHDQRWEEDSIAASELSLEEKQLVDKPPTSQQPLRDRKPTSTTSQSAGNKEEIVDRLPDRPRRSQPIAPGDQQSSRQRKPLSRPTAHRPYHGIFYLLSF